MREASAACRRAAMRFTRLAPLWLASCSWIFTVGPAMPRMESEAPPSCSQSILPPVLDTIGAVVGGGLVLLGALAMTGGATSSSDEEGAGLAVPIGAAFLGVGLGIGVPYTLAASYGFRTLSRCDAARAASAADTWTRARARQREESPLAGAEGHQCRLGESPGDLACDSGLACVQGGCERR
jgi:hypothetical protein